MSNSSPTILEKIRRNARHEAYAKARMLGYDATEAAREAWRVDIFILQMVEDHRAV